MRLYCKNIQQYNQLFNSLCGNYDKVNTHIIKFTTLDIQRKVELNHTKNSLSAVIFQQ